MMRHLIAKLATVNPDLRNRVEELVELPNYALSTYENEPFGASPWPKGLYCMRINESRMDKVLLQALEDEEEVFERRFGLPDGWNTYHTLDIIALVNRFALLTPKKNGNTVRNLARALMQIVEAANDPQSYIGRESGFPQKLRNFETAATWLLKLHVVTINATRAVRKVAPNGMKHRPSVDRLLKDYGLEQR